MYFLNLGVKGLNSWLTFGRCDTNMRSFIQTGNVGDSGKADISRFLSVPTGVPDRQTNVRRNKAPGMRNVMGLEQKSSADTVSNDSLKLPKLPHLAGSERGYTF